MVEGADFVGLSYIPNISLLARKANNKLGSLISYLPALNKLLNNNKINNNPAFYNYNKNITKFIYDTGATKHIVCNKKFFLNYKNINQKVKWGKASSLIVKGCGDILIRFLDNNKLYKLSNCFYIPKLGVNIISRSSLKNIYSKVFIK